MKLLDYRTSFFSLIEQRTQNVKKNCKYNFMHYVVPLIGTLSGITFLQAACEAAGNYNVLCILFEMATVISYGFASTWMISHALGELTRHSDEEAVVINHPRKYELFKHIAANILSIINTVIPAYISYHFNDDDPRYLPISLSVSYAFNVFAFYQVLNINFFRKLKRCCQRNNSLEASDRFVFKVTLIQTALINLPSREANAVCQALWQENINAQQLLHNIFEYNVPAIYARQSSGGNYKKILWQLFFLIFPFTSMIVNIKLATAAVKLLTDEKIFIILLAGLMVSTGTLMDSIFTVRTAGLLYDGIERLVKKAPPSEYLVSKMPRLNAFLSFFCFILAGLSASSRIRIADKTVDDLFIVICVGVNATIFEWYAQRDLSDRCVGKVVVLYQGEDSMMIKRHAQLSLLLQICDQADKRQLNHVLTDFFPPPGMAIDEGEVEITDSRARLFPT